LIRAFCQRISAELGVIDKEAEDEEDGRGVERLQLEQGGVFSFISANSSAVHASLLSILRPLLGHS
jgi:hypothetical protein